MTVTVRYTGTTNPYFELGVTGKPGKWTPGRSGDVSDADAALLLATGVFEVYADKVLPFVFSSSGAIVGARKSDGTVASIGSVSGVIQNTLPLTASGLIKTGPAKAYSLLITSGSGYVTLRDGTTIGGALMTGWGGGGTSGINTGDEATVNVPYAPSTAPTDFASGLYAEVSGTVTFVVFYQ